MKIPAALLAFVLVAACDMDVQVSDSSDDIAAIKKAIAEMETAYRARDWDEFTSYFTEDGIWLPPGHRSLQGKDEWWEFASGFWDGSTVLNMGSTTEELIIADEWAIERHSEFQVVSLGDDSEPITLNFKGVWVFRRGDAGDWKIARYIWNENVPAD